LERLAVGSSASCQNWLDGNRWTYATRAPAMSAGYPDSTCALEWNSGRQEKNVSSAMSATLPLPAMIRNPSRRPRPEK